MSIDRREFVRTFVATRWSQARTRFDIESRQADLWRRLQHALTATPALKPFAGGPLNRIPVATPADIRQKFDHWNSLGLTRAQAEAAASAAERGEPGEVAPGVTAGFSTGTSGARGVFLASRRERARYLGQALAKLLPAGALLKRWRIALVLRADSALYRDVTKAGPFDFHFVGIDVDAKARRQALEAFAPDILIAPSHVLADLARHGFKPSLERLFYGAEPMGEAERAWIAETLGARPDPIYQATEGFLGAACGKGALHLNEDSLIIERTPVAGTLRFMPIVTDLRRTSQPMVRVQLDDLLEPIESPCPCGSPLLAVHGVEGRASDLWRWKDVVIPPREVEAAMSTALGPDADWSATAAPNGVRIETDAGHRSAAEKAIMDLLAGHKLPLRILSAPMGPMQGFKRRRVRWSDA